MRRCRESSWNWPSAKFMFKYIFVWIGLLLSANIECSWRSFLLTFDRRGKISHTWIESPHVNIDELQAKPNRRPLSLYYPSSSSKCISLHYGHWARGQPLAEASPKSSHMWFRSDKISFLFFIYICMHVLAWFCHVPLPRCHAFNISFPDGKGMMCGRAHWKENAQAQMYAVYACVWPQNRDLPPVIPLSITILMRTR